MFIDRDKGQTSRLQGTVLLLLLTSAWPSFAAQPPRVVEQTVPWNQQSIVLKLNFPQTVHIQVWDQPKVSVQADVVLKDDNGDLSGDFKWRLSADPQTLQFTADFGPRLGHTVILQNGSDTAAGIGDQATLSGTEMTIKVPALAKLDVASHSGTMRIEHPGSTLLVNSSGDVEISVGQGIDLSFHSMFGVLRLDPALRPKIKGSDGEVAANDHLRKGRLQINGGGAETSVITVVGDIKLSPKPAAGGGLSQRQMLADFDQAVAFIDDFAVHKDLNRRRLAIDYPAEFARLREQIDADTDLCKFYSLLNQALHLVQDPHASTMSYDYFSQYGQYQMKYNFDNSESYAAVQKVDADCPQEQPALDLPITFLQGRYQFYADFRYAQTELSRGTEVVSYNGLPIEDFIKEHRQSVWPIRVSQQGHQYHTAFYRYGDQNFRLGLADGRQLNMNLGDTVTWQTPRQHEISYGSQPSHQVLYFGAEKILYIGIPMMDEALVTPIKAQIDAIVQAGSAIEKMIIDIRGNPGGSDATWHELLSHLLKRDLSLTLDMRLKDNARTRAHYSEQKPVEGSPVALLDNQRYWQHTNEVLTMEGNPNAIDYRGKIYLLQDPFIYSSAGNLSNFALFDDQIVSVGQSTDLVGGAQIEPLFFKLDHSQLLFRIEPVLDFQGVSRLDDYAHNAVEVSIEPSIEDLYLRSTFLGDVYAPLFLRTHDPLFLYVVEQ